MNCLHNMKLSSRGGLELESQLPIQCEVGVSYLGESIPACREKVMLYSWVVLRTIELTINNF